MGLANFIPTIWSAKLLVRLRKNLVAASVVNNEYEGEIKGYGDRVKINEIGPITVSDYTKYGTLTWSELTSAQKELIIDQAKSFSLKVDDIDIAQQNPKVMNGAMNEAAYAVADAHLQTSDFLVGDRPTIADISLAGYIYYPERAGVVVEDYPALARWAGRIAALPGWKAPYELMPGHPLAIADTP